MIEPSELKTMSAYTNQDQDELSIDTQISSQNLPNNLYEKRKQITTPSSTKKLSFTNVLICSIYSFTMFFTNIKSYKLLGIPLGLCYPINSIVI